MALDFNAVSLTPLTDVQWRALQSRTSGWSPPDGINGVSGSTMGPEVYRRRRWRRTIVAAGLLAGVVLFMPAIAAAVALYSGDAATLRDLGAAWPYILIAAAALAAISGVIAWFQDGGRNRTNAGAEPETRLTFTATTSDLAIADAAGGRLEGSWQRWRITDARATVWPRSKGGSLEVLESVRLVLLADDGTSAAGSVTLDPSTLTNDRELTATILAMITSAAAPE